MYNNDLDSIGQGQSSGFLTIPATNTNAYKDLCSLTISSDGTYLINAHLQVDKDLPDNSLVGELKIDDSGVIYNRGKANGGGGFSLVYTSYINTSSNIKLRVYDIFDTNVKYKCILTLTKLSK